MQKEENNTSQPSEEIIQPIWEDSGIQETGYTEEDFAPDSSVAKKPVWSEANARQHSAKVAMADGENINSESIDRMAKDLQTTGASAELDERMQKIAKSGQENKLKAAGAVSNEFGAETAATLFSAPGTADIDPVQALEDRALTNYISTISEKTVDELIVDDIEKEAGYLQELRGLMDDASKWEGSRIGDLIDIGGGLVPFNEQNTMRKLVNGLEEKGLLSGSTNTFTMGNVKAELRDQITSMSRLEQIDVFKFVDNYLRENSGIVSSNDMLRTGIFQELFSGAVGDYVQGQGDADKYINNAVSVLDLIGLGGGVKTLLKSGKTAAKVANTASVAPDSALATAERVSPINSTKLKGVAIIDETEQTAMELGTTKTEIKADLLPKQKVGDEPLFNRGASSSFNEEQIDIYQKIMKDRSIAPHLKETEINKQMEQTIDRLSRIKGGHLWKNASAITKTDLGLEVTGTIGKNAFIGFKSVDEVVKEATRYAKRIPDADVKIVARDYSGSGKYIKATEGSVVKQARDSAKEIVEQSATKRLVKAGQAKQRAVNDLEALPEDATDVERFVAQKKIQSADARLKKANDDITAIREGKLDNLSTTGKAQLDNRTDITFSTKPPTDYFIEVKFKENYKAKSNVDVEWETEIFGRGSKAAWLGDISTNLTPRLAKSLLGAHNVSQNTQKLMFDMLKPLLNASKDVKKRAIHLLQEGSTNGKNFTEDEIISRFGQDTSPKELNKTIEAYYSTRNLFDTMFELENEVHRADQVLKGNVHIHISDEFQTLGKPVDAETAMRHASHIYNPDTGKIEKFSNGQIADLYKENSQVIKSDQLHGTTSKTEYVLVKDPNTQIKPLPAHTLKQIDGYIPRMYDEQVFITARPAELWKNGVRLTNPSDITSRAVAVSKSVKQAKLDLIELQKDYPDMVLDYKTDRGLNLQQLRGAEDEVSSATGRLFYSKRGEHLTNVQGELADTQDIMYSIQTAASSLARKIDLDPVIDLHKKRWANSFGKFTSNGQYPSTSAEIRNLEKASDPEVKAAISYFDHIELSSSASQDAQKWRNWMFQFGEYLEGKGASEGVGSLFRTKVSEVNPLGVIRASAFIPMIVLNPVRQLFINSLQPLFLSGLEPKYVMSGNAHRQGLSLFKAAITSPTKAQAVTAGVPYKEWVNLVEDFKSSGMLDSISNHAFARDAFSSIEKSISGSKVERAIGTVGHGARVGVNTATKLGFGAGEAINRSITYMVARRRIAKEMDVNTKAGKLAVAQEADNLAMSMGQPGAMKYQQGIFSPALQFFSIQHKMLLSSFSRALTGHGNRNLTRAEAGRIAGFQLGIYGAAGMGITGAVGKIIEESGIELEEGEKQLLYGGSFDYFVNAALSAGFDEDSDLAFSRNIAGGGGFGEMFGDYMTNLLTGNKGVLELAAGPSSTSMSRIGTATRLVGKLFGIIDYEADDLDHKDALTSVLQITSGANNYIKGQAVKNHKQWVDKNLTGIGIPASDLEATIFQVLGISGYKLQDFYDGIKSEKKRKEALQDEAKRLSGDIARQVSKAKVDPNYARSESFERFFTNYSMYLDSLGADGTQISKLVISQLDGRFDKEFGDFNKNFTSAITNNNFGSNTPEVVLNRVNAGLMDKERGDQILMLWKRLHGENE